MAPPYWEPLGLLREIDLKNRVQTERQKNKNFVTRGGNRTFPPGLPLWTRIFKKSLLGGGRKFSQLVKSLFPDFRECLIVPKSREGDPFCQDHRTFASIFCKVGEDVKVKGGTLREPINRGTELGYTEGYLRASTCECFSRANLKDKVGYNLPAIIHFDLVEGNKIEIEYAAKGGGSENVSRAKVLPPAAGKEGVIEFVKEVISDAGGNPCPPITVGVGIGGTFEKAVISSKHALFRDIGTINPDPEMAELEIKILERDK